MAVDGDDGVVSLEWLLALPLLALAVLALLSLVAVGRDALLVHDAARAAARVAATTTGPDAPVDQARRVLDDRDAQVRVEPAARRAGQQVTVTVAVTRTVLGSSHRLEARATARVEPVVTSGAAPAVEPPTHPPQRPGAAAGATP